MDYVKTLGVSTGVGGVTLVNTGTKGILLASGVALFIIVAAIGLRILTPIKK